MMLDKRGNMYDHLEVLIPGLIVVAISLFWIFNVYFTSDDIDWEICRESLIMRNALPEKQLIEVISSKGLLDLKCGTRAITIDYKDVNRAEKEIGETMSACWQMVGQGQYKVFPGSGIVSRNAQTPCMMCARVHLDAEVKEFYSKDENKLDLERALNMPLEGQEFTVFEYLNQPKSEHKAFNYFKDWSEKGFGVTYDKKWTWSGLPDDAKSFSFPKYFSVDKGDLFIGYSEPITVATASSERGVKPYMFLIQYYDFDKLSEPWIGYELTLQSKVCSSIETIPS
jgi:hypothetical protein